MRYVRTRRAETIHVTEDLRRTACGRSCDGWIMDPDGPVTCRVCAKQEGKQ